MLLLVQAFAALHDGRPGGRVVFFTSGQYHGAMPDELPYIATKAALHELTRSLAVHLMPRGITVNCVDPGPNDTGYADPQTMAAVADGSPGKPSVSTPSDAASSSPGWSATRPTGSLDKRSPPTVAGLPDDETRHGRPPSAPAAARRR